MIRLNRTFLYSCTSKSDNNSIRDLPLSFHSLRPQEGECHAGEERRKGRRGRPRVDRRSTRGRREVDPRSTGGNGPPNDTKRDGKPTKKDQNGKRKKKEKNDAKTRKRLRIVARRAHHDSEAFFDTCLQTQSGSSRPCYLARPCRRFD